MDHSVVGFELFGMHRFFVKLKLSTVSIDSIVVTISLKFANFLVWVSFP